MRRFVFGVLGLSVLVGIACGTKDDGATSSSSGGGSSSSSSSGDPPTSSSSSSSSSGGSSSSSSSSGSSSGDGGSDGGDVDAGAPAVRLVGRNDGAANPSFAWPGARYIARFSGTAAKVTLAHADGFGGGPSYYDVIVNGTVTKKITVTGGAAEYDLVSGLAPGNHTVELFKRTEAAYGTDQFMGFTFPGGALLAPPAAPGRRLEFIGDSMIQGYGVEGAGPNCGADAPPVSDNVRLSMQARTAVALSADFTSITYSGKGLGKNEDPGDNQTFSLLYPRALPENGGSTWSFPVAQEPDVIVAVVGGTDFSRAPYPTVNSFATLYETFLTLLRSKNPNAHILGVVGGQLYDGDPVGVNTRTIIKGGITNAVAARNGAGDAKVYMFEFAEAPGGALTACDYHANPTLHQAWADNIVPFIKAKTGW